MITLLLVILQCSFGKFPSSSFFSPSPDLDAGCREDGYTVTDYTKNRNHIVFTGENTISVAERRHEYLDVSYTLYAEGCMYWVDGDGSGVYVDLGVQRKQSHWRIGGGGGDRAQGTHAPSLGQQFFIFI